MGQWERKGATVLAYAISSHMAKTESSANEQYISLQSVKKDVTKASTTVDTDTQKLHALRLSVCKVCRKHELYKCDLSEGWSQNCALLKANE
jgi:hypothetical protein